MGTRGGGNGGNGGGPPEGGPPGELPEGGPSGELPELPPDWDLVVPDDPSALAVEAAEVQRELYGVGRGGEPREPSPGALIGAAPANQPKALSLLIVAVALVATLVSLFALAWPGSRRPLPDAANSSVNSSLPSPLPTVPALDLLDAAGGTIALRSLLPAVVLLTDGCACDDLVAATVASTPVGISVLAVTRGNPPGNRPATPAPAQARLLVDPTDQLRISLELGPPTRAAAVALVTRDGEVLRVVPAAISVQDYRTEIPLLRG